MRGGRHLPDDREAIDVAHRRLHVDGQMATAHRWIAAVRVHDGWAGLPELLIQATDPWWIAGTA